MLGRMVETETTRALKAKRKAMETSTYYAFHLTAEQVAAMRDRGLPDSAVLAFAAIVGAAYGVRTGEWVALQGRTLDCFRRDYRWWARATTLLEGAGLLECQRHTGRMPRYRLVLTRRAPRAPAR